MRPRSMRGGVLLSLAVLAIVLPATAFGQGRPSPPAAGRVTGWLHWRGPSQNGVSLDSGLPSTWKPGGENDLWSYRIAGAGTPVIAVGRAYPAGRVYLLGYEGQGPDLQELLLCLDAATGKKLWERRFNDFLSDIIYDRYAIGSPCVDPETGNVYVLTSAGILACFSPDGRPVWQHSLMESLGRLTFPNGRTGGPVVEQEMVLFRGITSNWGADGPAADRFYAFDKKTGELIWSSTPGDRPKDSSFAAPVLAWEGARRVVYSGDGSGNVVCLNARTGQPIWRFPLSAGGINSSVLLHRGKVIAIHADENLDSSEIGRMTAVRTDVTPQKQEAGTPVMPPSAEAWRNELEAISSSPVPDGDRIYQVNKTGNLCCVDAATGAVRWRVKLGTDQLHASPLLADGKLYVPMHGGTFHILKPEAGGARELCKVQLEGRCLGAPSTWNGRIYVLTTERLYCFGRRAPVASRAPAPETQPAPGRPVALQVIPSEVFLRPGEKATFRIRGIDQNGLVTGTYPSERASWAKFIPPTARVRSTMNASFNARGELTADADPKPSAGAWEATIDGLKGTIRGRVLPDMPLAEDFEGYPLDTPHATETGVKFAYPPLPWIGARFKFEVRDVGGEKALAKTLDNIFFQRATVFIGRPESTNYTVEADVMSDGNRRTQSTVGLINQRYLIALLGNDQKLEVSSNQERVRASVPFAWATKTWYRLKTRVDRAPDGSGVVRAKAWKRGDPEPAAWTIETPHRHAHTQGAPGLYGFAPQSLFRVYIDNLRVSRNG